MAITAEEYLALSTQFRTLANHCLMMSAISPENKKLASQPMNAFERNRDFIYSKVPRLVVEAMEWAKATDWVELITDDWGDPCDLILIKPPF